MINGVVIDPVHTVKHEDGFCVVKTSDGYHLTHCVVDVGSRLHSYENMLWGMSRCELYSSNDIRQKEIAFSEEPRSAFIFDIMISDSGDIERFQVRLGSFKVSEKIDVSADFTHSQACLAKEMLDIVAFKGKHSLLTRSDNLSQLVQNMSLLVSCELHDFMVNKVGIPSVFTAVTVGKIIGNHTSRYRSDAGRLMSLNSGYAVWLVNGEALIVESERNRVVFECDNRSLPSGNYIAPIASPFRDDDAIVNQILLAKYLKLADSGYRSGEASHLFEREIITLRKYLAMTNRGFVRDSPVKSSLDVFSDRRMMKRFIALCVSSKYSSPQLVVAAESVGLKDIRLTAFISSYFIGMDIKLPERLENQLMGICTENNTMSSLFMQAITGMPFVSVSVSGGVVSVEVCDRVYEVDDCPGYLPRLIKKLIGGIYRDRLYIPSTLKARIQLAERLMSEPAVRMEVLK